MQECSTRRRRGPIIYVAERSNIFFLLLNIQSTATFTYNKFCMILRVGGIGDCAYIDIGVGAFSSGCMSWYRERVVVLRRDITFTHY